MAGVEEGRRRAPEKSVLLEAFRRGWASVSGWVPNRVKQEAQRYLDCGQLRFGFVEVRCERCSESRLIAFSCKGPLVVPVVYGAPGGRDGAALGDCLTARHPPTVDSESAIQRTAGRREAAPTAQVP